MQITDVKNNAIITILKHNKQRYILARGGVGGRGNKMFTNSTNRAPKICENGDIGENILIKIELLLLCHIGLVGFPNAGKSSFVNKITNARSIVGNYSFTTINPNLGTFLMSNNEHIFIGDIPGIIEGASDNKGMGFYFLKTYRT